MPPPPPYPYVRSATINKGQVEIIVELDPRESGYYVEVSGSATQTGGAFANFYGISEATVDPASPSGSNPTVKVSSDPLPPNKFWNDEDVTFVIRVSKVWLTVLGPQPTDPGTAPRTAGPADEGMTWNDLKKVSHLDAHGDWNARS